ncbi:FAD-binding oxidoreductase [Saccharothrix luteola]|uniref:FAD-binding oxidoreductase n=1 Tax=Saccharothrix luteola TaxID=2893018 RepID=UPI001E3E14A0|nr:FAD-binding protein [Saccharothrix luteola]MCC8245171.1 FAD-binding protein [Saccharothrix luteola]
MPRELNAELPPNRLSRRRLFKGSAAVAITAAPVLGTGTAAATAEAELGVRTTIDAATVTPSDPHYGDLVRRQLNQRFIGKPEMVRVVGAAHQVAPAVQAAVDAGKRITVISGGHCLEGFPFEPTVKVVLDVSNLDAVYYDPKYNAIAIESGATLLDAYEKLYHAWGVTVPGGICHSVGMGGHIVGGGWGMLCRRHGLIVDHLYGVEVVVVGADGRATTVTATREPTDPNRELWWAHTGGGGGNFGVVTRYLFRSPGITTTEPAKILPRPPTNVLLSEIGIPWASLTKTGLANLLRNFGNWHVANSAPNSPGSVLHAEITLNHQSKGFLGLLTQVDAAAPNAQAILDEYLRTVLNGVGPSGGGTRTLPWLQATKYVGKAVISFNDPTLRADYKSAYMRTTFTDAQIDAFYTYLTAPGMDTTAISVGLSSYGGAVNAVAPDSTAHSHRDSAYQLLWITHWPNPADDTKFRTWLRNFYGAVFADTGGVPVPNGRSDGCYINYPDTDLNDPAWNRSAVPWHDLYYKGNYPRLQRAKKTWDPRNIFNHQQSIRLPS